MNERGFILLHRKIMDNPIVTSDSEYFAVWILLLLKATHTEMEVVFNFQRITLNPGQLITGRKKIAEQLKINESKVDRILKKFENEHQIKRQTSKQNTLITIVNWNQYQRIDHQNEQSSIKNRTTDKQQPSINNNVIQNEVIEIYKPIDKSSLDSAKSSYGTYNNVMLTDDEFRKIKDLDIIPMIESLSKYLESSGKYYKNHYATIIEWSERNRAKGYKNENNQRDYEQKSKFRVKPTIHIKPSN